MRLGIDFGTTRTVVACCDRGNYPVINFCSENFDTLEWFPSLIAERNGSLVFGVEALEESNRNPAGLLRSFKRLLSDARLAPDELHEVGSLRFSAQDLLGRFLKALLESLRTNSTLTQLIEPDEALEVIVGAPANSRSGQRFLTLDGFRQAGFTVLGLLNEPSAAGFEYTHRYRNTLSSRRDQILVYDLGGGTFDASLVSMTGCQHDVVATVGLNRLGGDDFDRVLADLLLEHLGLGFDQIFPSQQNLLLDHCREAKERLHPNSRRVTLDVESCLGLEAPQTEFSLAVQDYYEACTPLIEKTLEIMEPLLLLEDSSENEGRERSDIAGLYVVGGASALPPVARLLRNRFGRKVHRSPYPSAAVAIGLAIAADEETKSHLTDRLSRTFGVFREGRDGREVVFDPVFPPDLLLPSSRKETVVRERSYRAAHNLGHFRFIECRSCDSTGTPSGDIGRFTEVLFPFDPALRDPMLALDQVEVKRMEGQGPLIRERYSVDADGIVSVCLEDLDHGYCRSFPLMG